MIHLYAAPQSVRVRPPFTKLFIVTKTAHKMPLHSLEGVEPATSGYHRLDKPVAYQVDHLVMLSLVKPTSIPCQ